MSAARAIFFLPALYACWLGMEAVHESGHVLCAALGGGRQIRVHLPPLGFSRTDVGDNPHPVLTTWGGPVWGALSPLTVWAAVAFTRLGPPVMRRRLRFFAGFCMIANGVYLGVGWLDRTGDAGDLIRRGTPVLWLVSFGVVACSGGLYLWHRLSFVPTEGTVLRGEGGQGRGARDDARTRPFGPRR